MLRIKSAFLGAISSLCVVGGKCDQYWSAIGPVLVTHSKQYWSRREVVLVTSPTSTGRKTDLVEGCRTVSCEGLIVYGRLSVPLHSVSSSRGRTKSSLSNKSTRCPHSTRGFLPEFATLITYLCSGLNDWLWKENKRSKLYASLRASFC